MARNVDEIGDRCVTKGLLNRLRGIIEAAMKWAEVDAVQA